jgi:hypothetical protein
MFRLIDAETPTDQVRRITFVPFLVDGRCVLIERADGPVLPSGEVLAGEDYALDTVLRVPLEPAGFRYQRFGPFGLDDDHLYAWIEGAPYPGTRPHAQPELSLDPPADSVGPFPGWFLHEEFPVLDRAWLPCRSPLVRLVRVPGSGSG